MIRKQTGSGPSRESSSWLRRRTLDLAAMSGLSVARDTVDRVNRHKQASGLAAGMLESTFRTCQLALSTLKQDPTIYTILRVAKRVQIRVRLDGFVINALATIMFFNSQT